MDADNIDAEKTMIFESKLPALKSKKLMNAGKIAISVLFLVVFAVTVDIQGVKSALCKITLLTALNVSLLITIVYLVWSVKWKILIPQYPLKKLVFLTIISQYYSVVLPGQISGEFVKIYRLAKDPENAAIAASSIIADKISGMIALVLTALFGAVYSSSVNKGIVIFLIVSLVLFFILLVIGESRAVRKALSRLSGIFLLRRALSGPSKNSINDFFTAWHTFTRKPVQLVINLLLSIIAQISSVYIVVLLAKDLDIHIALYDWFWVFGMVSLAVLLPVSIGGIGVREGSFMTLLMPFGISPDRSMALSFLLFFFIIVVACVGCILEYKNFIEKIFIKQNSL